MMALNLGDVSLDGVVFSGRPRGEQLRQELRLDLRDVANEAMTVRLSDDVITVTSSFFLGLFGPSIVSKQDVDAFFRQYHFTARSNLMDDFRDIAKRALASKTLGITT